MPRQGEKALRNSGCPLRGWELGTAWHILSHCAPANHETCEVTAIGIGIGLFFPIWDSDAIWPLTRVGRCVKAIEGTDIHRFHMPGVSAHPVLQISVLGPGLRTSMKCVTEQLTVTTS